MKFTFRAAILAAGMVVAAATASAEENLKPFVQALAFSGDPATVTTQVGDLLTKAGFEIVGHYRPYAQAEILIVTNDALKQAAAQSQFGGYGAALRVAITSIKGNTQVSYTDPRYMAAAYRMKGDGSSFAKQMEDALGKGNAFGSGDGLSASDLRDYRYMFGMEHFTDPDLLAQYPSQQAALEAAEKNLAAGRGGVTKVYRIDIPGKAESVFGVALKGTKPDDQQDDRYIMSQIDFQPVRSTAHLPYEMLVSGGKIYALAARFRIAIDFPDLSMMGSNSFMSIMGAPNAIRTALTSAAGGDDAAHRPDLCRGRRCPGQRR